MIGLVLITGLVAIAVVALLGQALAQHLLDAADPRDVGANGPPRQPHPHPSAGPSRHESPYRHGLHPAPPSDPAVDPTGVQHGPTDGRHQPGEHQEGDIDALHHRSRLALKARLTFVYSPEPGCVVLDCTLVEFDDDINGVIPPGTPFTLELSLPQTAWFASSLELLLEQWASECRVVEIALLASDGHAKAHVGDGSSRLMLDVDSAAGLSVS